MYKYILRFSLVPSRNFDEKMQTLLDFCEKAEIDDVMFFIAPEELSVGHITIEEAKKWTDVIVRARDILAQRNITVSLNPWVTLGHYDGGRKLQEGQNFRTMVGLDGTKAETVVCPLCENWREYYAELMNFYVDTIKPDVLWFEDDFRLSNHEPVSYGCFCDEHVRLINEKLGEKYTRKQLETKIYTDENVRKACLEVLRFTLEDTFSYLINKLPAQRRFGIMTSGANGAIRDARRHEKQYSILSQNGEKPHNRLNLGAYRQVGLQEYAWTINGGAMWHRQICPDKAHFVSEIENFPHTLYTKSAHFMKYQLLTSAPVCLEGATLSIFEFNGNGIVNGDKYAKALKEAKPFLSKLNDLGLKPEQMQGVYVLYSENSAFTIQGNSLCPHENWWASYLEQLGIACVFGDNVNVKNRVVALGGQVVRNYTREQIEQIFANNFVLVSAECAQTLCDMGMGDLIGAKSYEIWKERTGKTAMEQIATGEAVFDVQELRATTQFFCGDQLSIDFGDTQRTVYTHLLDYRENVVGEGIVQVNNAVIFPFFGNTREHAIPIALLAYVREYALKKAILSSNIAPEDVYFIEQENVCPYVYKRGEKTHILFVNFSDDEYRRLHFRTNVEYERIRLITPTEPKEKTIGFEYENGYYWVNVPLAPQSCVVLACDEIDEDFL